jgi:hypothetical protein
VRWWIFRVGIPHTTWCICCSQYAHNFVMQTGTPHMQNFLPSSPYACGESLYAYGGSPYAYGDQFLTDQRSFCQSHVEAEFCARTRAHSHQKSSVLMRAHGGLGRWVLGGNNLIILNTSCYAFIERRQYLIMIDPRHPSQMPTLLSL